MTIMHQIKSHNDIHIDNNNSNNRACRADSAGLGRYASGAIV